MPTCLNIPIKAHLEAHGLGVSDEVALARESSLEVHKRKMDKVVKLKANQSSADCYSGQENKTTVSNPKCSNQSSLLSGSQDKTEVLWLILYKTNILLKPTGCPY